MWETESESVAGREFYDGVPNSNRNGVETDGFELKGKSWHVSSDIPSDLFIQVEDISFYLHKFPLISRSGKINRIIYESRNPDLSKIVLDELPGGPEAFELAAKFCYGVPVDLIFKTEAFLSYVVLSSWRDSIIVLKSCEKLSPWAENLQIVRRCSESIAWKACANPKGIKWAYAGRPPRTSSPSWNEMQESSPSRNQPVPPDWWFEDVSILRIDHFVRVITGLMKEGTATNEDGGNCSISHGGANSWKGGLHMVLSAAKEEPTASQAKDQRMIIESLISIIPPQRDSVSCSFLLRLNKSETSYDVDLVQRLLEHFLVQEQMESSSPSRQGYPERDMYETNQRNNGPNAKTRVARLVDSYLTEVAKDRNLSLTTFQVLAEALPDTARSCDDGLYRAIDSYLKAHPTLTEHERKRLCRVMDCQKLSLDACMHAAQNERLPLRVVVQVLFSEQVKISNAIANNSLKEAGDYQPMVTNRKTLLEGTPQSFQEGWSTAKKDINTLKFELQSMKAKYDELQSEMDTLQRQFDKMGKQKPTSAWSSGWKKLSKLTKANNIEPNDSGPHATVAADQVKKAPRRWRNSIS